MKTNRKGFTIVELTIVIAVIAILAAVLIPTFVSLVNKANNSADVQMVTNINKYLASMEALDGKNATMHDALQDAEEAGYNAGAFLSANNTILWNQETDRFLAVDGKKVIASDGNTEKNFAVSDKYWIVSATVHNDYSTYLNGNVTVSEVKHGLDVAGLTFENKDAMFAIIYNGNSANVIFNGEFKSIVVAAENADCGVHHYGFVGQLTLTKGAYTENGFVGELTGQVFPADTEGTDTGSFVATGALFRQTETEIAGMMQYRKFEGKGAKYDQHYFGANSQLKKCLCCATPVVNPDHICELEMTTIQDNGKNYIVLKCKLCGEGNVRYEIPSGSSGGGQETVECQHEYQTESREATCTVPGYTLEYCKKCGKIGEHKDVAALGHKVETVGETRAATCTVAGSIAGKRCSRCNTVLEAQRAVSALGHDYSTTKNKCGRCHDDRPSIIIDQTVLREVDASMGNGWYYIADHQEQASTITFGYKEDYVHAINGFTLNSQITGVDIYGVTKKNPNYGENGDTREYVVDLYVLSDKTMCYELNDDPDLADEPGLFAAFGIKGALKSVNFENFDTSKTVHFDGMFNFCVIERIDISSFVINGEPTFNFMFASCETKEVICPAGWEKIDSVLQRYS